LSSFVLYESTCTGGYPLEIIHPSPRMLLDVFFVYDTSTNVIRRYTGGFIYVDMTSTYKSHFYDLKSKKHLKKNVPKIPPYNHLKTPKTTQKSIIKQISIYINL